MKKSFVLIVSLVLFVAMVGGCSPKTPPPSPEPVPEPEPEPEPEPLWNFDEEEFLREFLGQSFQEIESKLGPPESSEDGIFWFKGLKFFSFNRDCTSAGSYSTKDQFFGLKIGNSTPQEAIEKFGENYRLVVHEHPTSQELDLHEYSFHIRALWKDEEREFIVSLQFNLEILYSFQIELLP